MGRYTQRFSNVLVALLSAFCLALALSALPSPVHADEPSPEDKVVMPADDALYSTGEMLVVFQEGTSEETIAEVIQESETADPEGTMVDGDSGELDSSYVLDAPMDEVVVSVVIDEDTSFEEAAIEIAASEDVVYVQPNFLYVLMDEEESEDYEGLEPESLEPEAGDAFVDVGTNDGFTSGSSTNNWHLGAMHAVGAWNLASNCSDTTVAVIDTGCDLAHVDLVDNLDTAHAYQAVSNSGTTITSGGETYTFTPQTSGPLTTSFGTRGDINGHGTHVCGIIGATANNGIGVAGVTYNTATVLPINIFNTATRGDGTVVVTADTATVVVAYNYLFGLVDNNTVSNLRVVNMSIGGYRNADNDPAMHNAIERALNQYGILTVVSGGNANKSANSWPSDYDECISVVAIRRTNWDTDPSRATYSDFNSAKDISAPGGTSPTNYGILSTLPNDSYGEKYGTSMAAPMVSGTLAMMFAVNPELSAEEARSALYTTATDLGTSGRDDYYGWGLVNAEQAVASVIVEIPVPKAVTGLVYTGSSQTGVADGAGYTVSGGSATAAGSYTATVTLMTGHIWSDGTTDPKTISWSIAKAKISVPKAATGLSYTGSAQVGVASGNGYTVSGNKATDAGSYTATVKLKDTGNTTWSDGTTENKTISWKIAPAKITAPKAETSLVYTGSAQTGVASGSGYTLSGTYEATGVGSYKATATLDSNYVWSDSTTGAKTISWKISAAPLSEATVTVATTRAYTGSALKPVPTVTLGGRKLVAGTDYTVSYKNNVNPGTATVTITGKGNYTGTKTATFKVTQPFADVNSKTPHYADILWLYANGISTGWKEADGTRTFMPYSDVARCDMAAFLYRLAGSPTYTPTAQDKAYFSDVDSSTPHAKEVWWLAHEGISTGWVEEDGTRTFRPYDSIARCDMAAFLYRLAGSPRYMPTAAQKRSFSDVDSSTPHAKEVWWLASTGVSEGWKEDDGTRTFRPYDEIARCDMAAFLHRMDDKALVPQTK